jgi:hypothetical protein
MPHMRNAVYVLVVATALITGGLPLVPAMASSPVSLIYNYQLASLSGDGSYDNLASGTYHSIDLAPLSTGTSGTDCIGPFDNGEGEAIGTSFLGWDFTSPPASDCESVAWAKPGSVTLNNGAGQAIGEETQLDDNGGYNNICSRSTSDPTPNVSQVGRSGSKSDGQVKIQLDYCGNAAQHAECFVFGDETAGNGVPAPAKALEEQAPLKIGMALTAGDQYNISCIDIPINDMSSTLYLQWTDLATMTTKSVSETICASGCDIDSSWTGGAGVGAILTSQAISIGNKYPMDPPSSNTGQLEAGVNANAYCQADPDTTATLSQMRTCLANAMPAYNP